jgi:hypothetical protein
MLFYPQNVVSQGVYPNSLSFRCFHLGFKVESIKELGGASFCASLRTRVGNDLVAMRLFCPNLCGYPQKSVSLEKKPLLQKP